MRMYHTGRVAVDSCTHSFIFSQPICSKETKNCTYQTTNPCKLQLVSHDHNCNQVSQLGWYSWCRSVLIVCNSVSIFSENQGMLSLTLRGVELGWALVSRILLTHSQFSVTFPQLSGENFVWLSKIMWRNTWIGFTYIYNLLCSSFSTYFTNIAIHRVFCSLRKAQIAVFFSMDKPICFLICWHNVKILRTVSVVLTFFYLNLFSFHFQFGRKAIAQES